MALQALYGTLSGRHAASRRRAGLLAGGERVNLMIGAGVIECDW